MESQDTLRQQRLPTLSTLSLVNKKNHVFATRFTTLVLTDTKDKIISLSILLKADYLKMEFADDTSDDPNFGEYLITPVGSHVTLVFESNLGRVPLWDPPIRVPVGHTMPVKVILKSGTTHFLCSTQDLNSVSTIKHR